MTAASEAASSPGHGHAFISYVREDSGEVDALQRALESAGVPVWRDTASLWPGEDWRTRIRRAITDNALVFIVCFSRHSVNREKSYQNEEIVLAVEQMRRRQPDDPWLIPVRFDDCTIPDLDLGGGRTLASIQRADLFGNSAGKNAERLIAAIQRILDRRSGAVAPSQAGLAAPGARPAPGPGASQEGQEATRRAIVPTDSVMSAGMPDVAVAMNGRAGAGYGFTDRWRLTHTFADVPAMSQLGNQGFDHPAYMRPAEQTPAWVRIRAVVACDLLGETPGWQDLRGRFAGFLVQESIRGLINELTDIPDGVAWRQRGTQRRSWLEADLTTEDPTAMPAASAILFLPERETLGRLDDGCAHLTLHIDFAPRTPLRISGELLLRRPPYWRARFEQALALPGELAGWLEHQLGLATSNDPAAQSGIMLKARQTLAEMVDVTGITALPAPYTINEFTGWAVADAKGETVQELASQVMLDLSERVFHLDGNIEEMTGLA